MRLLKPDIRTGIVATLLCVVIAFAIWPIAYDRIGSGAEMVRTAVLSSETVLKVCPDVRSLYIVPWRLSIEDSPKSGSLRIGYWMSCQGTMARVDAALHHQGRGWLVDELTVEVDSQRINLAAVRPEEGVETRRR